MAIASNPSWSKGSHRLGGGNVRFDDRGLAVVEQADVMVVTVEDGHAPIPR